MEEDRAIEVSTEGGPATEGLPAPLTAQALEKTQISKYYTKVGHGFAAEDANNFADTIRVNRENYTDFGREVTKKS